MMNLIPVYSFIISLLSLVLIIFLSRKYRFFLDPEYSDRPQHYHTSPTPRAGGIGILLGMGLFLLSPLGAKLMLPVLLAFFSGIFEDYHRSLSPRMRLTMQTIAALSAIWLTGAVVTYLGLGISMPYWMGILFSTFAIIGMMNAVNIIDGFNGLAAGVVLLILLSFGITALHTQNNDMIYVISIVTGTVMGFLVLNFPTGKIFLGDGGAYLLGFIIALIGIFLASKYESISPWHVLAVFIYPVWEVLFSIYRKIREGKSPLSPDDRHLHMLIFRHITHSNPGTSLFILACCAPFILLPTFYANNSGANFVTALMFIVGYTLLYRYLSKKEDTISPIS